MRGWVSLPCLLQVVRGEGDSIFLSPMPPHGRQGRGRTTLPLSHPQGQLAHASENRVSSTVLPRQGARGPWLPSVVASEGRGRLCAALASGPSVYQEPGTLTQTMDTAGHGPRQGHRQQPRLDITISPMASRSSTSAHSSPPSPLQNCLSPKDMNHSVFLPLTIPNICSP